MTRGVLLGVCFGAPDFGKLPHWEHGTTTDGGLLQYLKPKRMLIDGLSGSVSRFWTTI